MRRYYDLNEESERMNERGFEKVPIEDSQSRPVEVYNVYTSLDPRAKCKKKIYNAILIILIVIVVFMIVKIINLTQLINEDPEPVYNNDNYYGRKYNDPEGGFYNDSNYDDDYDEFFYIGQKKEDIKFDQFSSSQLRKPEKIKLIEKLKLSLDVEYDNLVHLKIIDPSKNRWEVPEKDVLDKEYLKNRNENKVGISKYSRIIDSRTFYVEFDFNDTNGFGYDPEMDYDDDYRHGFHNSNETYKEFSFRLVTQDSEEFYSFTTKTNFLYSDTYINFEAKLTSNKIYGFGERTHDFQLKDGIYTIGSFDCGGTKYDDEKGGMNQYSHQPIGLHKTKYNNLWLGFVFLNTNEQDVIIRSDKNDTFLTHKTTGGIIDYYIVVNDSPEEVLKTIQTLLGVPPLPPFWSFGIHQSRYGYKSFEDFKNVYEKYKSLGIPIDAMWLDIDALEKFEIFTLNDKFKDIAPYIVDNLHKDGGKFIPVVDYGFSYENPDNKYVKLGDELNIFIKSNYTNKNLVGKAWPEKVVYPDFLHPNASTFWNKGLEDYYNLVKYDGIWLDMNEPANLIENEKSKCKGEIVDEKECTKDKNKYDIDELPYIPGYRKGVKESLSSKSISENAIINENYTVYDTKPLLSYFQVKHTYNYLNDKLQKRPFILSRSASLGSGKYTYHWSGDNLSSFGDLKNSISSIFNFNIFGIPFTGSDICGFMENASKELCIRWYNLGAFYPFSRNHNFLNAKEQYPWSFDDGKNDTINIIKKSINIRYSLLRYMYSQFFLISLNEKGSFFKPVMFEFPEDEASYEDIESKIMFGESFLTVAFYEENENNKKIEFPDDNFNIYPSGKSIIKGEKAEKVEKGEKMKNNNNSSNNSTNEEEEEEDREIDRYRYGEPEPKKKVVKKKNNRSKYIKELSGKLDEIHIFLRGGYIVPYQDVFNKYILNTLKLREEKINLIINIDPYGTSTGVIFFDNDGKDTVINALYHKVDIFYSEKKMTFTTTKYNMTKYDYNDHILGVIEFWRASEVFKIQNEKDEKTKVIKSKITFNNNKNNPENIEGVYDKENNKAIFEISTAEKNISIFDIKEMVFN